MATVTFLADIQRNVAAVFAAAEYVNTDRGVLFFKFGDVSHGQGKDEAGSVHSVFMGLVIGESIWVNCTRM